MVTKHCCWGTCDSDSRQKNKDHMKGVTCIPFVKPHIDKGKCERGAGEFNISKIDKYTYICSKVIFTYYYIHINNIDNSFFIHVAVQN